MGSPTWPETAETPPKMHALYLEATRKSDELQTAILTMEATHAADDPKAFTSAYDRAKSMARYFDGHYPGLPVSTF